MEFTYRVPKAHTPLYYDLDLLYSLLHNNILQQIVQRLFV